MPARSSSKRHDGGIARWLRGMLPKLTAPACPYYVNIQTLSRTCWNWGGPPTVGPAPMAGRLSTMSRRSRTILRPIAEAIRSEEIESAEVVVDAVLHLRGPVGIAQHHLGPGGDELLGGGPGCGDLVFLAHWAAADPRLDRPFEGGPLKIESSGHVLPELVEPSGEGLGPDLRQGIAGNPPVLAM